MNSNVFTIDNLGNMINEAGEYVGYYDTDTKTCILLDTGQATPCPQNFKEPTAQPKVQSSQTFFWVALIGFILFVIIGGYWYINSKKAGE